MEISLVLERRDSIELNWNGHGQMYESNALAHAVDIVRGVRTAFVKGKLYRLRSRVLVPGTDHTWCSKASQYLLIYSYITPQLYRYTGRFPTTLPSFWHTRRSTLAMQNPGSLENAPNTLARTLPARLSPPEVPVESQTRRLVGNG